MSLFLPNIPQPGDNLDFSQGQLLTNNQGLDTVFAIDHYAFSDGGTNKGFHNVVTQPIIVGSAHPATAAGITKIYAMQDTANIGLLEYSRGPSSPVPTPITSLQSTAAALTIATNTPINVLDFTGVTVGFATLYAFGIRAANRVTVVTEVRYIGGVLNITDYLTAVPSVIFSQVSGSTLQLNTQGAGTTDVYWTLVFDRIQ